MDFNCRLGIRSYLLHLLVNDYLSFGKYSAFCINSNSGIYVLTQHEVPGFATFLKVLILLHTSIHIHNTNKQKYGAGFDIQENNGLHDKLTGDSQHSPVQSVPILDGSFRWG